MKRTAPNAALALAVACAFLAPSGAATGAEAPGPPDDHATVRFLGNATAELYSREISESLQGVLQYNYISEDSQYPVGFVRASPAPQPWYKTFWTRDGGTFLRELVKWGYLDQASHVAQCMIQLVGMNQEGYHSFPRYFDSRTPRSGGELDGTSAIIIGMTMLQERLPAANPVKDEVYRFLHGPASPVRYIEWELRNRPLLPGEGEFGGGMGTKGPYYNVVQNQLSALALRADARMEDGAGDPAAAREARADADKLTGNILKYLVGADGAWIWCIDPKTMKPNEAILHSKTNLGFGGINAVLSMSADVSGLEPAKMEPKLTAVSWRTFEKLHDTPERKRQFDRYGIWTQFDLLGGGMLTGPSYGMGYAIQDMLLFDHLELAAKGLEFLAQDTYRPVEGYALTRRSPYYFYERMYSPEAPGKVDLAVGCGALNLVNVSEPLKLARIMIGIDDSDPETVRWIPRVPDGWSGFDARGWAIVTRNGVVTANLKYEKIGDTLHAHFLATGAVKSIVVRLPKGGGWKDYSKSDCQEFDLIQSN